MDYYKFDYTDRMVHCYFFIGHNFVVKVVDADDVVVSVDFVTDFYHSFFHFVISFCSFCVGSVVEFYLFNVFFDLVHIFDYEFVYFTEFHLHFGSFEFADFIFFVDFIFFSFSDFIFFYFKFFVEFTEDFAEALFVSDEDFFKVDYAFIFFEFKFELAFVLAVDNDAVSVEAVCHLVAFFELVHFFDCDLDIADIIVF